MELAEAPTVQCAESIIASKKHFHIETLNITDIFMNIEGGRSIDAIIQETDLLHLILQQCHMTDNLILAISNGLARSKLTSPSLKNSRIGGKGIQALANVLPQSRLTLLNLILNNFGLESAQAIAAALPESKLVSLDLGRNPMNDEAVGKIAATLPESMLTSLYLGFNEIGA